MSLKEILLLPITLFRGILGLFKAVDDYSEQKDWEDGGWEKQKEGK